MSIYPADPHHPHPRLLREHRLDMNRQLIDPHGVYGRIGIRRTLRQHVAEKPPPPHRIRIVISRLLWTGRGFSR
ncbi:hypothetical protein ACLMAL_38890 [Nocardia sp. CWNU-33]|uniref:hypothetical protein n=1 Tax=Nocardia sp. CWNU-33 TaxID=3392117 RepID=UPI00398F19AC